MKMGLYAVQVEGKYGTSKTKMSQICVLLEAKDEKEEIRQAQTIFLAKFPLDYIQEFNCIKVTLDATKKNPSSRNPVEVYNNEPRPT
jgi:hypothetical protein